MPTDGKTPAGVVEIVPPLMVGPPGLTVVVGTEVVIGTPAAGLDASPAPNPHPGIPFEVTQFNPSSQHPLAASLQQC